MTRTWNDGDGPYQVSFAVEKSRRYHEKMASFYTSWVDYVSVANALIGLGAFMALFGGKNAVLAQVLVGAVAIAGTITATLKPPKKAKLHEDLQRRFTKLSAEIAKREPNATNVRWAENQRKMIEVDEPKDTRRLVDFIATNEERRARGHPDSALIPLTWAQRHFGYLRDFGIGRIDRWHANR